jgi:hypothetical protein
LAVTSQRSAAGLLRGPGSLMGSVPMPAHAANFHGPGLVLSGADAHPRRLASFASACARLASVPRSGPFGVFRQVERSGNCVPLLLWGCVPIYQAIRL